MSVDRTWGVTPMASLQSIGTLSCSVFAVPFHQDRCNIKKETVGSYSWQHFATDTDKQLLEALPHRPGTCFCENFSAAADGLRSRIPKTCQTSTFGHSAEAQCRDGVRLHPACTERPVVAVQPGQDSHFGILGCSPYNLRSHWPCRVQFQTQRPKAVCLEGAAKCYDSSSLNASRHASRRKEGARAAA